MEPRPTPRHGSIRAMLVNTGWMLGGKGVGAVLSTIYLALAARSLGLEGFAQFALALGIGQTVAGLVTFQSWQIIIRYGMAHLHAHDDAAITRLVRFATLLDLAGAAVGLVLVVTGFLLLGPMFGWSTRFTHEALIGTAAMVVSFRSVPLGVLRLYDRFATATAADTVTPVVRFVGALLAWWWAPTPLAFLVAWSVAELATAIAFWAAALRLPELRWRRTGGGWAAVRGENPGILRFTLVSNLAATVALGGKQVSVLLVGLLVAPAAAGGFRFAQQLAQALAKVSTSLARAIFPELMRSEAGKAGGRQSFDWLFVRTTRLGIVGGAAVLILILLVGKPAILLIAGPEFLGAYPLLVLLGAAAAIDFAAVGLEPALTARGRAGTALVLRTVAMAATLGAMPVLAYRYGASGASGAILIGSALSFILMWRAIRRAPGKPEPAIPPS